MGLNAAGVPNQALPNGVNAYLNPRATFGLGDALGEIAFYSTPISRIISLFQAGAGGPLAGVDGGTYQFTAMNNSAHGTGAYAEFRSGYLEHEFRIPVAAGINVSGLLAPAGWSIIRETDDVLVQSIGTGTGLLPGDSLNFSFISDHAPGQALPNIHWAIDGIGQTSPPDTDMDGDPPAMTPVFDTTNFGVLDGTFDYSFNAAADHWDIVPLDSVLSPAADVPEPASLFLAGVGFSVVACYARRHRLRRSASMESAVG